MSKLVHFKMKTFISNFVAPLQVIEGKSVGDGKFKTFGYSLNGGIDMDSNSYPDLLVGTLDDRIALLR